MLRPRFVMPSQPSPVDTTRKRLAPTSARITAPVPRTRVTEALNPLEAVPRLPLISPLVPASPVAL